MKAIHLKITGRVQGVFFRSKTKEKADELELTGWVKNCDDGSVEVFAQGDEAKLNELEKWCHKGPATADIQNVERLKADAEEGSKHPNFKIRT